MPIVSSVIFETSLQHDGRFWSGERHTDQLGATYEFRYLADVGTDTAAVMNDRVPTLNAQLKVSEIQANLQQGKTAGASAVLTFFDSTLSENFVAIAETFASASSPEVASMTDFVLSLDPAVLEMVFHLTEIEVAALQSHRDTLTASIETLGQELALAVQQALNG